jgi:hypothetical protein
MTFSPLLPSFEHSRLKYYALAMASSNPWDHDVAKSTGKPATPSTRPRSRADDWPSTPPGPSEPFPSLPLPGGVLVFFKGGPFAYDGLLACYFLVGVFFV